MPYSVECLCGRTYSKPDHKAGTFFRCHVCGREVLIPKEGGNKLPKQSKEQAGQEDEEPNAYQRPRPSHLRTTIAWVMIFLGLAGVVGGLGTIFIESAMEHATADEAWMARRTLSSPSSPPWKPTPAIYLGAIGSIGIGAVLTGIGFRLRRV